MQGSTLAVARWPGATRNWCRATKLPRKLHFGGPIGQLKFQGDDVMRITSNGAECYCHLITMLNANSQFFFAGIRSQIKPYFISSVNKLPIFIFNVIRRRVLPPFISDAKDKHPTFILVSYGDECYRHSFPTLKTNTRHLFLASYGAECYRHSFPTLKTNTQQIISSVIRSRMLPSFISNVKDKHPTFILASYGDECYRHSFPTLLKTNTRHLFLVSYGAEYYRHSFPTFFWGATKFPIRATKHR